MGKISPVSSKYIVHATIEIDGVVDRPDVIGAIFGQTEGLLGSDLELRELQRSGKIGRIEVNAETRTGKTKGTILIPSSLDKAETSIIAAALEIIQRIGPCTAKIAVSNIEDVRVSKRNFVIGRAKELLKDMMDSTMPDSQELADEVAYSVRVMEIEEYGKDRLPAGPSIDDSDEIIIVEGRADVITLLKHGFKNAIAMNGTSVPETIIELSKQKVITAFVDGDRGGKLIIKGLSEVADIDYVSFAPDGKEVEEITKKEIHKALRSRISGEQANLELGKDPDRLDVPQKRPGYKPIPNSAPAQQQRPAPSAQRPSAPAQQRPFVRPSQSQHHSPQAPPRNKATPDEIKVFKGMLEDLIGTRGAHILDDKLNILGKVPISELQTTMKSLSNNVYAIVFDGVIDRDLVRIAEKASVDYLVAMDLRIKPTETRIEVLTVNDL
ncbi:MAG: DNA primase DnaG [Candidatus Woesearchaeota archaeon]|nr:DNA primase DnaG [Candidatus Woesearchaeota archaeon]